MGACRAGAATGSTPPASPGSERAQARPRSVVRATPRAGVPRRGTPVADTVGPPVRRAGCRTAPARLWRSARPAGCL